MTEPERAEGGGSRSPLGTLGLLSPGLGEPRQAPALRAAGWRVLWTPVLEIAPLAQLPPQTLQTLTSPPPDAWLLLASPSAAAVLLQMVPARQLQAWEGRVAAVGESTAAPLREAGLQVRCPPGQGAGGAQAALEEVLLPQGARHCVLATGHAPRGQLQHRARQAGIACTLAQLYRRIPRRPDPRQLREALLGDWILATDANSLRRLHRLAEESLGAAPGWGADPLAARRRPGRAAGLAPGAAAARPARGQPAACPARAARGHFPGGIMPESALRPPPCATP